MTESPSTVALPDIGQDEQTGGSEALDPGYLVICRNDPVNLMTYVTHVFRRVFGWNRPRAEKHMLEVHEKGRSVLTRETLERAEFYVHRLQNFRLQATLERERA